MGEIWALKILKPKINIWNQKKFEKSVFFSLNHILIKFQSDKKV